MAHIQIQKDGQRVDYKPRRNLPTVEETREVERHVIATLIANPSMYSQFKQRLSAELFFDPMLGRTYRLVSAMAERGMKIDMEEVWYIVEFEKDEDPGFLEKCMGEKELTWGETGDFIDLMEQDKAEREDKDITEEAILTRYEKDPRRKEEVCPPNLVEEARILRTEEGLAEKLLIVRQIATEELESEMIADLSRLKEASRDEGKFLCLKEIYKASSSCLAMIRLSKEIAYLKALISAMYASDGGASLEADKETALKKDIALVCRGLGIKVDPTGRLLVGLCPFHAEKTPSFTLYPNSNEFYCFGCNAHGDNIQLVMDVLSIEFAPALHYLAKL